MIEDALVVSHYPIPPSQSFGTITDYSMGEDEDNGDLDYVQSLCPMDYPDNDTSESFSEKVDTKDSIESEEDDTIELELEMEEGQLDDVGSEASSLDDELDESFNSEVSSDFGDIFNYEHDVSQDLVRYSTPVDTPIGQDRRIFRAAMNDSVCLAKGDEGPNVSWVESHYNYDSDDGQPYHVEGYFRYPTKREESFSFMLPDTEEE